MIRSLSVKSLFGLYSYNIPFIVSDDAAVTILTGGNGLGKTTILEIIDRLYKADFLYFFTLPFDTISIEFEDQRSYKIEILKTIKERETDEISSQKTEVDKIHFVLWADNSIADEFKITRWELTNILDATKAYYMRNHIDLPDDDELIKTNRLKNHPALLHKGRTLKMFLRQKSCKLVTTVSDKGKGNETHDATDRILAVAKAVAADIASVRTKYGIISQNVDATFVPRLINRSKSQAYADWEYADRIKKLNQQIGDYRQFDLIDNFDVSDEYPQELKVTLSQYVDDMEHKIQPLQHCYQQLSLLAATIKREGLANKEFGFNRIDGIVCYQGDSELKLSCLSSGEKNLLILFYNIIFNNTRDGIILIDEPENSLHVQWQAIMLAQFMQLSRQLGLQIVIATHSPSFIQENWDLTLDLEDINNK